MKENHRKCVKCGSSLASDPDTKLYRFPRPGTTNILRCEMWAKYCYPDKPWATTEFQMKLNAEHKMLCHRHFKETAFIDYPSKMLHRFAYPEIEEETSVNIEPVAGPSRIQPLMDVTNQIDPIPGPSRMDTIQILEEKVDGEIAGPAHLHTEAPITPKPKEMSKRNSYLRCLKHVQEIRNLRKKIKYRDNKNYLNTISSNDAVNKLQDSISGEFALLLQSQVRNFKKRSTKGRRWSLDDKITSLRIYKRSPTCYKLLRRMFCLPAPTTLKCVLRKFSLEVGINKSLFEIVGKAASTPIENEYTLMFDEMSIRKHLEYNAKKDCIMGFQDHGRQGRTSEPASYGLVFMVGCIRKRTKQPLAYYLSGSAVTADRLVALIKEVLGECHAYKINISVTVCDMDGVNRRAMGILGANAQKPYFEFNNKKVFSIFDAPHLIKCFRNLFLKYDIECSINVSSEGRTGKGIAKWQHIVQLYEIENTGCRNFIYATNLRQDHLNPNSKQKMKVNLAVQVLSHSVAAGLYAAVAKGELPAEAAVTADVVTKMDSLFDTLNSDTKDCRRGKKLATNLKRNNTQHISFINEMKDFFLNMKFVGARCSPPSLEGWLWTLNGIQMLWESLCNKHQNLKSLSTRRLQQDPLENLFGCIRAHCGSNSNPTTTQFVGGLKTSILARLSHMTRGNCENDNYATIIANIKILLKKSQETSRESEEVLNTPSSGVFNTSSDSLDFHLEILEEDNEFQACAYVCGFILKKYFKNDCIICKNIMHADKQTSMHIFTQFKEYSDLKQSLIYASKDFVTCVEYVATFINNYLEKNAHKMYLYKNVNEELKNSSCFNFLNTCAAHKSQNVLYIIKSVFYINVKRFCIKKNRLFKEDSNKVALAKKINILKHR